MEEIDANQIQHLIVNIRNSDLNTRLNAVSNLPVIAKAIGPDRTENELIPYTMETTDHTGQVYQKIAKSLYKIFDLYPEITLLLILNHLKTICENEEQSVRNSGTKSMFLVGRKILTLLRNSKKTDSDDSTQNSFTEIFLPFIYSELCENQWYPLKCVGAALLSAFYRRVPKADHKKVKLLLLALSTDNNVLVRKSVAVSLPSLINPSVCTILNITNTGCNSEISSVGSHSSQMNRSVSDIVTHLLKHLSADKSAAVLIEVPESLAFYAQDGFSTLVTNKSKSFIEELENLYSLIIEFCQQIVSSNIWQAVSVLISFLNKIFILKADDQLIPLPRSALRFIRTLSKQSIENENLIIKTSLARQISFLHNSRCFSSADFQSFLNKFINDKEIEVRVAVCEGLSELFSTTVQLIPIEPENLTFIESILSNLLNDIEIEVKIASLKCIAVSGIGIEAASSQLRDLLMNNQSTGLPPVNWRTRQLICGMIPKIAANCDEKDFDKYKLPEVVVSLLNDDANEVRRAMIESLPVLTTKYGLEWQSRVIAPMITDLYFKKQNDYQLRKTAVEAVLLLKLKDEKKDLLRAAVKDPVANVRLVLARELPRTQTHLLKKLMSDPDEDVAYYASQQE